MGNDRIEQTKEIQGKQTIKISTTLSKMDNHLMVLLLNLVEKLTHMGWSMDVNIINTSEEGSGWFITGEKVENQFFFPPSHRDEFDAQNRG